MITSRNRDDFTLARNKMRLRNSTTLVVDRQLWRELANPLGLTGTLPTAIRDELAMYPCKSLRVEISSLKDPSGEHTVGSYSSGRIQLFACPRCSFGFVTWVFLHELFHAWTHQTDESRYESTDHCDEADAFSDRTFLLLGGKRGKACGSFHLSLHQAKRRLPDYRSFVADAVNKDAPRKGIVATQLQANPPLQSGRAKRRRAVERTR